MIKNTKKIKVGSIVSTTKHSHRMTFGEFKSKTTGECKYFVGADLHIEIHDLKDLTFISD